MKRVHFIGIGGSGLSAIAMVLLERGYTVSGSDRVLSLLAKEVAQAGGLVVEGHMAANIRNAEVVLRSSAVQDDNPEVVAARAAGIPILKRADFLEELIGTQECVAIAGTHGKTTTTAMIAWVLSCLGTDPSYIIGGVSKNLGGNAHSGKGPYFVIEADEYDHMFLGLAPKWAVVTVVEHDHPDCFPTPQDYQHEFEHFVRRIQPEGALLCCADDPGSLALAGSLPGGTNGTTYGFSNMAAYQAQNAKVNKRGGMSFELFHTPTGNVLTQAELSIPGMHNVANASAVLALVHLIGLDLQTASLALAEFSGTGRRFELRGVANGTIIIDDYAHHPTEIKATLAAARQQFPRNRIWAVWQPHTYSRTRALLNEFAGSFAQADRVIVTEVFAAREKDTSFSAAQVVEAIADPKAVFVPSLSAACNALAGQVKPGDVVLVLSAGDADRISDELFKRLKDKEQNHA